MSGMGGIARSVLIAAGLTMGAAGLAGAQQSGNPGGGTGGAGGVQSGGVNGVGSAGMGAAAGAGLGVGGGASPGGAPPAGTAYGAGAAGTGPVLNNMRANGTALYMSPNPRAPNVSGRAAPTP
ncbi:hypothetical protein SAMN06265784_11024 [Paraburkholderia susongensis]|uniref:Uncharacterized protein n=2 Tax=Paraburkholderia susongensis TaxID=1515439 RepID=A0A1X7LV03_9BURK|nr:hypothetical protein SAMN06265784_11024 [Paraburkholderia susongensis]